MASPVPPLPSDDLDHVLAHTRELWAKARGQSFFITGGTGFFGIWLLESFARANDALALGMRATVLTRDPAVFAQKAPHLAQRADFKFHQGDLRTFAFPDGQFAHIIHAAADTGVWMEKKDFDGVIDAVEAGTRHLLNFVAQAGVKNFLLISSGAVYGPQPAGLTHVPEDYPGMPDPLLPDSAWGAGKRVAEDLCTDHAARHGYAVKIARGFAFVGPHLPLDANYAMGNFLRDALRGEQIRVKGDGTPIRSYLYAADLAIWLWTILFRGQSGRPYNVGSTQGVSIADLADMMRQVLPQSASVKIMQKTEPGRPQLRYVPSVLRAEVELGLQVRIPLMEAIQKTAAWHMTGRPVVPR
jgi:dTDP-glucose 4,6-dehydratase